MRTGRSDFVNTRRSFYLQMHTEGTLVEYRMQRLLEEEQGAAKKLHEPFWATFYTVRLRCGRRRPQAGTCVCLRLLPVMP